MCTLAYRKIILTALFSLFIFCSSVFFVIQASASEKVNVYFFRGEGCPHCAKEEKFLEELEKESLWVTINSFEVWHNHENALLLQKIGEEFSINVSGVPVTFVGDKVFSGYSGDNTTGDSIRQAVGECHRKKCHDTIGGFISGESQDGTSPTENDKAPGLSGSTIFHIPFIGEMNAKSFSLPVLTIVIGALDGFNPCAMWVLIYLVGLLLGIKGGAKRWILGLTFIAASAAVYFLFMAAWLNFLLFVGLIIWVRMLIGAGALGFGAYNISQFIKNPSGVCDITKEEKRQKTFVKLRDVVQGKGFVLALGGIILIAFAVNLVELMCSAGFPAIYTHVLTLSNLSIFQYYAYLLLYVFVFMLDDMIIFTIAMLTLRAVGLDGKYVHYSRLVGGIIILILGLLLLLKPQLLMFG